MRESADLDELDLLLVTALQTSPRASWQRIGDVLGVDASTAARRWERLTEAGLAWLNCHPMRLPGMSTILAVIGFNCVAARLQSVAVEIAEDPHVFSASHVTGSYDLIVVAVFVDQVSLGRYLRFRVGRLDGVQSVHVHVVTRLHTDGSRWRLDRLDATRGGALLDDPVTNPDTPGVPDATDLALMTALSANPRRSAADLACDTQLSTTSVRRRLVRLRAAKVIACRCDIAHRVSGWPISATFWGAAPPDRSARVAGQLAGLRETRFCVSLSGPDNLMFTVWLRSMDGLQPFETFLAKQFPEFTVTGRSLNLWPLKRGGHILDPDGRRVREVPMSLWPEQNAIEAETTMLNRMRPVIAGGTRANGR